MRITSKFTDELTVALDGSIATVTFLATSLCRRFQEDLWRTMDALESNADVTVIIFTGRRQVFMTGAELGEIAALRDRVSASAYLELPHSIVVQFCNSRKVLIAAINGYCLGGGLELALACDYRIAVDAVTDLAGRKVGFLGFPEARLGLVPALGGGYLAAGLVGLAEAKELFFQADPIDAEHALRIGLVNRVVTAADFRDDVQRMAARMSAHSPLALGLTKQLLERQRNGDLEAALAQTRTAFAECCAVGDLRQRIGRAKAERVGNFRNLVSTSPVSTTKA